MVQPVVLYALLLPTWSCVRIQLATTGPQMLWVLGSRYTDLCAMLSVPGTLVAHCTVSDTPSATSGTMRDSDESHRDHAVACSREELITIDNRRVDHEHAPDHGPRVVFLYVICTMTYVLIQTPSCVS